MFLKDVLPDISLPVIAAVFIAGIAAGRLSGISLAPVHALLAGGAAAVAAACFTVHTSLQRAKRPGMPQGEVKKCRERIGVCILLLWFCFGAFREGSEAWPGAGPALPEGISVSGAGLIEEMKPLNSGSFSGPRYQIIVRLQDHGEKPDEIWKRQQRILLVINFSKGSEGETDSKVFGQNYIPGARVYFSAAVSGEEKPGNPGGFDYGRYLRTKGIFYRGEADSGQVSLEKEAGFWRHMLAGVRTGICRQIEAFLDPKVGAVVSGCFLGDQSLMDRDDKEMYKQAGIAHLFSVSGTHGGILLGAALHLERFGLLKKRKGVCRVLALGLLLFYLSLTGFPLSMQRTFIMACMAQAAALLDRKGNTLHALAAAALVLLWFSPLSLFSAGFQLSFGVTWGIIHLYPWLRKSMMPLLALPVAAQIASMPIQGYWFYQIQPAGFLMNLWAVSLMPPLLLLSGLSAIAGMVNARMASLLWQAPGFLAAVLDKAAHLWTALPYTSVNVKEQPWPAYVICGVLIWLLPGMKAREKALDQWLYQRYAQRRKRETWRRWQDWRRDKKEQMDAAQRRDEGVAHTPGEYTQEPHRRGGYAGTSPEDTEGGLARDNESAGFRPFHTHRAGYGFWIQLWIWRRQAALLLAALVFAAFMLLPKPLRITFLDVGQGDGIVFTTPSGKVWMADGGSSNVSRLADYRLEPFLRSQGINRIDYIVISHGDNDHISGVMDLLAGDWAIGYLIAAPQIADTKEGLALIALAEERDVVVAYLSAGQSLRDGEVVLQCLHPEASRKSGNANDVSLVAALRYRRFSLLLTGDIDRKIENELLPYLSAVNIVKVAHHGSGGGTSEGFLRKIQPGSAVISCGKKNLFGHPHPGVLKRLEEAGIQVFQTMEQGAIQVTTDGYSYRIYGYKK